MCNTFNTSIGCISNFRFSYSQTCLAKRTLRYSIHAESRFHSRLAYEQSCLLCENLKCTPLIFTPYIIEILYIFTPRYYLICRVWHLRTKQKNSPLRYISYISCILFIILQAQCLCAQPEFANYNISYLTQDDGLSQGSNYFRYEDNRGFMWLTCNDALNRYDGSGVKVYNLNYYFKNCPALQQGYGFAEDANYLYIGSTRGLYRYDYAKDEFTLIQIFQNALTKSAMPIGFAGGKLWCYNETYQLAGYDPKTGAVTMEAQIPLEPIRSMHIYAAFGNVFYYKMPFIDKRGHIFFTGKNELLVYDIEKKEIKFPLKNFKDHNVFTFQCSAYDAVADRLYLGTTSNGVLILENNYQKIWMKSLDENYIASIAISADKVAFKTGSTLFIADKNFKTIFKFPAISQRSYVYGFDKIGRLWYCEDGMGQVIITFGGTVLKSSHDFHGYNIMKALNHLGVNNIVELPDQSILINSKIIFTNERSFSGLLLKNNNGSISVSVKSFADPYVKGFWTIADDENKQLVFFHFYNQKKELSKKIVFASKYLGKVQHVVFFENHFPMVCFSGGVYWLNTAVGKLEKIKELPDDAPFYISRISKDRVLISYLNHDAVLAAINENGNIQLLQKVLPNVQSFYFAEDEKKQQFWAGTNEGVYLLDKNFKPLKKFDGNNDLSGTYIYGILLDDFGTLWCSHQRGLSAIHTETFHIINFDKSDGIQHWDFNNRTFLKASDGTLYFGGVSGFNYFKPPLQFHSFYKPEIYFDEILINNKRYSSDKGLNALQKIDLQNDENNIIIKALLKDLKNGAQRSLYYKLGNAENIWRKIPKRMPLVLTGLAPGKYEIAFGVSDKFHEGIMPLKKIVLHINKAYYQTFWFWALVGGVVFGGIVFAIGRWKLDRQRLYYRQKLALENQRNKITADLHDDIGASLSSLQINAAIAGTMIEKNKTEEAQNTLKKIEKQSHRISENISDIVWSLRTGKDEFMTMSSRIITFVNEILSATHIQYTIRIDDALDKEITGFTERKNIVLIAKEAVNNAAKYSDAAEITVSLHKDGHNAILIVQDDGRGFDSTLIKAGNGLVNMKKRAMEIGGTLAVNSCPGSGTIVQAILPLP